MTSTFLKGTGTLFYKVSSIWASPFVNLMIQVLQFGQNSLEAMCPSQYSRAGSADTVLSPLGNVKLKDLWEMVHDRFLHCKRTFSPSQINKHSMGRYVCNYPAT